MIPLPAEAQGPPVRERVAAERLRSVQGGSGNALSLKLPVIPLPELVTISRCLGFTTPQTLLQAHSNLVVLHENDGHYCWLPFSFTVVFPLRRLGAPHPAGSCAGGASPIQQPFDRLSLSKSDGSGRFTALR